MLTLMLMIRTTRGRTQREPAWVEELPAHLSPALMAWFQEHQVSLPHSAPRPGKAGTALTGITWIEGGGCQPGEALFVDALLPEALAPDLTAAVLALDAKRQRGVVAIEHVRLNRPVQTYLSTTDPRIAIDQPQGLYEFTDADLTPVASLYAVRHPDTAPKAPTFRTGARTPSNLGRFRSR